MKTVSLAEARKRFSEILSEAERFNEQFTVTKNGKPAAVIVSSYEWETLEDTLFWLSQPGILEDIAEARRDLASGSTVSAEMLLEDARRRVAEETEETAKRERRAG
jgi:prevent-host-death family protein